jgi:hypothetical protein
LTAAVTPAHAQAEIFIEPERLPPRYLLPQPLAEALGGPVASREQLCHALWRYVVHNRCGAAFGCKACLQSP